jgi:lysophospholipase L1-like esterase
VHAVGFVAPGAGRSGSSAAAARRGWQRTAGLQWSRYVALGDSFTAGIGDPEPRSPGGLRGWADRIAEELGGGRPDFRYANLAVSGLLLRQIIEEQLGPAIALQPDLVTLSAGGNDLVFHRTDPDRLAATLDAAVGTLSATGATVVLFTGPDLGGTPLRGHNRGRVAVFNENIRTIAARHHGVIADLWALRQLSDPRMWDPDRLHFSPMGHHTIAAMVLNSLSVPHSLSPLEPKPLPAGSWRDSKAGDIAWFTTYLLPWMVSRVRKRPDTPPLAPKRPEPGPVS